ncbi:MAG TPA: penicillin acylase family protein, partial [Pyrinomonadaceae bacterium]|nr:penicillin acylase family protein [Pyrinomonadaceae bacterium]
PGTILRERILYWAVKENSARWLPAAFKNYDELIRSCDTAVRAGFADPKRYGPDIKTWTWGRIWQSRFPHPLAVAPLIGAQFQTPNVPLNGSGQTPNVGSSVSMRHIATPGNWDTTSHVIPLGQSGDPKSPHFKDQFDAWSTGATSVFPFTKAAVEKAAVGVTVLKP